MSRLVRRGGVALLLFSILFLVGGPNVEAYSLLTHEQLVDLTWRDSIVPILKSHYPNLTDADLDRAHAYAYGGCAIQDIGYYPFGDPFFSELTHYVRTGDFITSLFRNAHNADEMAFAVGALSHYIGDTVGHAQATNLAVPIEFPRLGQEFGPIVTYAEAEHAHVQTEFAFDINEIAHHRLAPLRYTRHVGLRVPRDLLATAFFETYGLSRNFSTKRSARVNVRGYRFVVRLLIPRAAYAVTLLHRGQMPADPRSPDQLKMEAEFERVAREENWDQYRRKPGLITYSLAGLICILPKIGPLKLLAIRGPRPATEEQYVRSVNRSTDLLRLELGRFILPSNTSDRPEIENRDLDTGARTQPGNYKLTDETYARWLHRVAASPAAAIPRSVKHDLLNYYSDPKAPILTRMYPGKWATVQSDLTVLRSIASLPDSDQPDGSTSQP